MGLHNSAVNGLGTDCPDRKYMIRSYYTNVWYYRASFRCFMCAIRLLIASAIMQAWIQRHSDNSDCSSFGAIQKLTLVTQALVSACLKYMLILKGVHILYEIMFPIFKNQPYPQKHLAVPMATIDHHLL